jgi:anti-sigma factor RsiW
MNHPTREEWVPYLFGETKSDARRQLNAHLKDCPDCRQEIENWKMSLGLLDAWKLPPVPGPAPSFAPLLNWAVAAAVVLLVGFGIGRLTAKADVQKVRAAIEPELRRELTQEFARLTREEINKSASSTLAAAAQQTEQAMAVLGKEIEDARAEDNRAIYAAMDKLESDSFTQFVSLKKDVDTVAVNTDAGLRNAAQELVQLADYKQPLGVK